MFTCINKCIKTKTETIGMQLQTIRMQLVNTIGMQLDMGWSAKVRIPVWKWVDLKKAKLIGTPNFLEQEKFILGLLIQILFLIHCIESKGAS